MFKSWLALVSSRTESYASLAPDIALFVIGDIHGRFDLLTKLLKSQDTERKVICIGDYIDRGEQSAEVLRFLQARPKITCLKGNHEEMLLAFLDDPKKAGPRWLRYGGLQTLSSFEVVGARDTMQGKDLEAVRDALTAAMGEDLICWIRSLPLSWQTGNIFVTHAGCDPTVPLEDQEACHLLWGHPNFNKKSRSDGFWIVHGHTIVDTPSAQSGRIAIDTGAFATGRLTAAVIETGSVKFLSQ